MSAAYHNGQQQRRRHNWSEFLLISYVLCDSQSAAISLQLKSTLTTVYFDDSPSQSAKLKARMLCTYIYRNIDLRKRLQCKVLCTGMALCHQMAVPLGFAGV